MAEWFKAAVLKTASPKGDVGSNPTPSATNHVGFVAAVHLTWCTAPWIMRHALNRVRSRVSPKLNIVHVGCMAGLNFTQFRAPVPKY